MISLDRVVSGVAIAASLTGAAAIVFAQSVLDPFADSIERWVGGGILTLVAFAVVRWNRQTLKDIQDLRDRENDAALEREKALLDQLASQSDQNATLLAQLEKERALRLSLEHAGIVDRRMPDDHER